MRRDKVKTAAAKKKSRREDKKKYRCARLDQTKAQPPAQMADFRANVPLRRQ